MRFVVIGLGSMGKRRIRNLQRLGWADITGYDPRADRRDEAARKYGIATLGDWPRARTLPADAWIVSTPPDSHMAYALEAIDLKIAFFTEAGVPDPRTDCVIARARADGIVAAPSCTMRYYPGPRRIKALMSEGEIGRALAFTYHCGQYLPEWHPWESYKDFYVSNHETGACREIVPFELAWITDVFGPVAAIDCHKGRVSDLDANIDDIYQLLLRFETGVFGHLLVDVIAQPAVRAMRINGTGGTIEWDHGANRIRAWTAAAADWRTEDLAAGSVEDGYIHAEEPYVEEMADFVAAVRGEHPWPYGLGDDEAILDLLIRAERSAVGGVRQ